MGSEQSTDPGDDGPDGPPWYRSSAQTIHSNPNCDALKSASFRKVESLKPFPHDSRCSFCFGGVENGGGGTERKQDIFRTALEFEPGEL